MADAASSTVAVTRGVSPQMGRCELTHVERRSIDVDRAMRQHQGYERCLESLGCSVVRAAPAPERPDSVFVEDTAVVLDGLAMIARPGAPSRRGETAGVADVLRRYRPLRALQAPATLDGGDVLRVGRKLFVGLTARTNAAGVEQLTAIAEPLGYHVARVPVLGCLHLKTAVTEVADGVLLANPQWVDPARFPDCEVLRVDPKEPFAANGLRIGTTLVYPSAYPRTRRRVEAAGVTVAPIDLDELAKAEGAVTCCSLIVDVSTAGSGRSGV